MFSPARECTKILIPTVPSRLEELPELSTMSKSEPNVKPFLERSAKAALTAATSEDVAKSIPFIFWLPTPHDTEDYLEPTSICK